MLSRVEICGEIRVFKVPETSRRVCRSSERVEKKGPRGNFPPDAPPQEHPLFLLCNLAPLNFALSCAGPLPHATRRPLLTHFSHVTALHDYDTPSTLHVWFPMRRILQLRLNEGVVFAGSR